VNADYTIYLMHKAVSPITHMEGKSGNVQLLMRQSILFEGSQHRIPCITGNAMRNRLLRDPSSRMLKERLGLNGHLSAHQDRFLSSGQERSVKGNSVDIGLMRRGYALHPHIRLLGGTLPTEVVGGRASVGFGVLCCRETKPMRESMIPPGWGVEDRELLSWQSMVELRQYVRKSDDDETVARESDASERKMMPFSWYTITAGSVFIQRITLNGVRDIDAGCAVAAIESWDGTVGGSRSRGHGLMDTSYCIFRNGHAVDGAPLAAAYDAHIEANKQAMIDWIFEAVGEKTPKELSDGE